MDRKKASLLISMPPLEETIFHQSVILLVEQDEEGALGFIFNKDTGASLHATLRLLELESLDNHELPLLLGGPVQNDFFWFVHAPTFEAENSFLINESLTLSPASQVLGIKKGELRPVLYAAGIGYSGWGPGQLEEELEEGAWWQTDFDSALLLETPIELRWSTAFEALGAHTDQLIDRTDLQDPTIN